MSGEVILARMNGHPELWNRVESMLPSVDGGMENLKEADCANSVFPTLIRHPSFLNSE